MDDALRWLHWWTQECWLNAHPDWQQHAIYQLPYDQQICLARSRHLHLCQQLHLLDAPPQPDMMVLRFIALSTKQQQHALTLVANICGYRLPERGVISNDDERWCRRIALALRPGRWLDHHLLTEARNPQHYGLILLCLGSEPAVWQRLKLIFQRDDCTMTVIPTQSPPQTKLRPVFEAAIWHAEQESER